MVSYVQSYSKEEEDEDRKVSIGFGNTGTTSDLGWKSVWGRLCWGWGAYTQV